MVSSYTIMEVNNMGNNNWGFETRQLHVGQEQADPTTDARYVNELREYLGI